MVAMAHTVIKKTLLIATIILFTRIQLFSQQKIEPSFLYKNPKNDKMVSLDYFLSTLEKVPLPNCLSASGNFKFLVDKNGLVGNITVSGNLPDTLVKAIKKRISLTNGHWKYNDTITQTNKWFVYPVYVENIGKKDCLIKIEESYYWLIQLYDKTTSIINTPTSYLIRPGLYSLIY